MSNRYNVVSLAQAPFRQPYAPLFTPIAFGFPLNDSLWAATYLSTVRRAVQVVGMSGREILSMCAVAREQDETTVPAVQAELTKAIVHFEELAEMLRTAQVRLREADGVVSRLVDGGLAR